MASTSVDVPNLAFGAMRLRVSQQRWLRLMLDLDFGPGCSNLGLGARSNDGPRRSASAGFLTRCSSSVQLANRLVRLGSRTVACGPCALRCTCTAHFGVSVDSGRQGNTMRGVLAPSCVHLGGCSLLRHALIASAGFGRSDSSHSRVAGFFGSRRDGGPTARG